MLFAHLKPILRLDRLRQRSIWRSGRAPPVASIQYLRKLPKLIPLSCARLALRTVPNGSFADFFITPTRDSRTAANGDTGWLQAGERSPIGDIR